MEKFGKGNFTSIENPTTKQQFIKNYYTEEQCLVKLLFSDKKMILKTSKKSKYFTFI